MKLAFDITFEDLYTQAGLEKVDAAFCTFLTDAHSSLLQELQQARHHKQPFSSAILCALAPYVEDFLAQLFGIPGEIHALQQAHHTLSPLWTAKRQFVQRRALKKYPSPETLNGSLLQKQAKDIFGATWDDLSFATTVLRWLETPPESHTYEIALQYAAWATRHPEGRIRHKDSTLFSEPGPSDHAWFTPDATYTGASITRCGFNNYDPGFDRPHAIDHARYCLWCHHRDKDTCRTGLNARSPGCPLDQKISEMNELKFQGWCLGALATVMIDNPMVAATGHRICNDCRQACIFQNQEPVNIPAVETQILKDILALPWGFEIYSLLSRWNPLNASAPLPASPSGKTVLVVGLGPAGFTLAHYLLNSGHTVIAIDGLKIEPLPAELSGRSLDQKSIPFKPIKYLHDHYQALEDRPPQGFGGVAEYGITVRWDKNFLLPIRLLLERHGNFTYGGGIRFGGTLTPQQAFDMGVDHIALCVGAGKPNSLALPWIQEDGTPHIGIGFPKGVRLAADFLMALQGTGAHLSNASVPLSVDAPILVIGGGLTAVDAATEALALYQQQTGKTTTATILYRGALEQAPSYRLNSPELAHALAQGVQFISNALPHAFIVDEKGHICGMQVQHRGQITTCPARGVLVATGTHPNTVIAEEWPEIFPTQGEFFKATAESPFLLPPLQTNDGQKRFISFFGDVHPDYYGSVVKAMASAKNGYPVINKILSQAPARAANSDMLHKLLTPARVIECRKLNERWYRLRVHAPLAARAFQPGVLYKLQRFNQVTYHYSPHATIKSLAVTSITADGDCLDFLIWNTETTARFYTQLQPGEPLVVMGPTGMTPPLPNNKRVLVVAEESANASALALLPALRAAGNQVSYHAIYADSEDTFPYPSDLSADVFGDIHSSAKNWHMYEQLVLCLSQESLNMTKAYASTIPRITLQTAPLQCMLKGICGRCIVPNKITGQMVFACQYNWQIGETICS